MHRQSLTLLNGSPTQGYSLVLIQAIIFFFTSFRFRCFPMACQYSLRFLLVNRSASCVQHFFSYSPICCLSQKSDQVDRHQTLLICSKAYQGLSFHVFFCLIDLNFVFYYVFCPCKTGTIFLTVANPLISSYFTLKLLQATLS